MQIPPKRLNKKFHSKIEENHWKNYFYGSKKEENRDKCSSGRGYEKIINILKNIESIEHMYYNIKYRRRRADNINMQKGIF